MLTNTSDGQSPVSQPKQNCVATCITTLNKETAEAAATKLANCSTYLPIPPA